MFQHCRWMLFSLLLTACSAGAKTYELSYLVAVHPERGEADVSITLEGERLPSRLSFHLDPQRHSHFTGGAGLSVKGDKAIWQPAGSGDSVSYRFTVDHRKGSDSFDAMMSEDWAVLRSDHLVPPISVRAEKGLKSRASIRFELPAGWSSAMPYESLDASDNRYRLRDPGRRFIRPKGWLILGAIASRQDEIAGVNVRVAAPRGQDVRLQDALAFINWTLPHLREIFPGFPPRMLVVSADDPMWRGGLSAPNSLFMHADRPLVSGNRTSSLVHEMVHIGTSIHGTERSDWIVEGIAEYYAVEILRRSGGISERRFQETLDELAEWGEESPGLFTGDSSGPTTAKAVGVMVATDREIRARTGNAASLDDVATALAEDGGEVTVAGFVEIADRVAGGRVEALAHIREQLARD